MKWAYYNDNDPNVCTWLRELIRRGVITDGEVDCRSIADVQGSDVRGFLRVHFFAGIGGWDYALRLADWPDDRPVATASCPCQPFSCSGLGLGEKDERHLWPELYRVVSECDFPDIYGEQVASLDGLEWLDGISLDLEELGYAVGAADYPAAGVQAPQLRQRIYWAAGREARVGGLEWLANAHGAGPFSAAHPGIYRGEESVGPWDVEPVGHCGSVSRLAGAERKQRDRDRDPRERLAEFANGGVGLGHAHDPRPQGWSEHRNGGCEWAPWATSVGVCGNDGTWRRIEPGIPPLAPGLSSRVALIRGSGNSIVPQVAARFIEATCYFCSPGNNGRAAPGFGVALPDLIDEPLPDLE